MFFLDAIDNAFPLNLNFFQIQSFQKVLQIVPVSTAAEVKVIIINIDGPHALHGLYMFSTQQSQRIYIVRSPLPGACNSHTASVKRRFHKLVYF